MAGVSLGSEKQTRKFAFVENSLKDILKLNFIFNHLLQIICENYPIGRSWTIMFKQSVSKIREI